MINTLKKLISFFNIKERKRGLKIIILVIFMGLLETLGVVSIMPFLTVIGNPNIVKKNYYLNYFFTQSNIFGVYSLESFIIFLGLLSLILIIFSSLYRIITLYFMNKFTESMRYKISTKLLNIYLFQKYEFFLNRHSSELTKSILSEIDHIVVGLIRPIITMIANSIVALFIVFYLFFYSPKIALTVAGTLGLVYCIYFIFIKGKMQILGEKLIHFNKVRFQIISETFSSVKLIKLRGLEDNYRYLYKKASKNFSIPLSINLTLTMLPKYMVEVLAFGGVILLVTFLIIKGGGVNSNTLGAILPTVGLYVFAAYRLQPAIQSIFNGVSAIKFGSGAVNNLYSELKIKSPTNITTNNQIINFKKMISLENLSFVYPNSDREGLSDINFNIPVRSSIGIVGSTGAGKTTLVDILLGLLLPTRGSIRVDDKILDQSNIRSWQNLLGYVPQEITLFDSSIGENIAMGVPRNQINWSLVENCTKMAQIHKFITLELPDKYETCVGERGVRLSGGQRQRIGIARALYHNPQVLVLDEATSALDLETEKTVIEAIKNLSNHRTVITIAHRLSTVKNCDQIIMLDKGKIKKIGSFYDVIENNGNTAD